MVTYLNLLNSKDPGTRSLGMNKLAVYMEFLSALKDNYPAASILGGILKAAREATLDRSFTRSNDGAETQFKDLGTLAGAMDWLGHDGSLWLSGNTGTSHTESA